MNLKRMTASLHILNITDLTIIIHKITNSSDCHSNECAKPYNNVNLCLWMLFTPRPCAAYIFVSSFSNNCACGTFRSFPFVHIVLQAFDYTARVKNVLHTTGCS